MQLNSGIYKNQEMQSYKLTSITHFTTQNRLIENSFFTSTDWLCFDQERRRAYHDYYINSLYKFVVDIAPVEGNICTYKAISFGNKATQFVAGNFDEDSTKNSALRLQSN